MNQIAWQIYGGSNRKANTFIGGVASAITTSGALASRLGIASNRITNFKIVGSNIECRISGGYGIPTGFCANPPSIQLAITYYRDFDGLVTSIGQQGFYGTNVREVYTPNATNIGAEAFDQNASIGDRSSLKILYIPRVTTIGATVLNNNVFRANTGKPKIYAHPSLQTINSGGVEGDLALAIATGATVVYVTSFTAPNSITNLSVGNVYGTAVQLNFTAPSSTNAIEFYEVYVNGVYKNNISGSGSCATGLTFNTAYTIEVKPVDIFYNKSTSNVVSATTANPSYTDADANAYISAATLISSEQESAYQLITDLKTAGLWTKIQAIYPFKGTTAAQHKWNAKNPLDTDAAFRLAFSGTGNYSNLGFQTNGSNAYANTFYNPTGKIIAANSGLTIVTGTNNLPVGTQIFDIGAQKSSPNYDGLVIMLKNGVSKNQIMGRAGTFPNGEVYENMVSDSKGSVSFVSQGLSLRKLFRNGFLKSTATTTTIEVMPNHNLFIGSLNNGGSAFSYSNQRIQMSIIHQGLSDTEVATLHAIIDTSEAIAGRKTW